MSVGSLAGCLAMICNPVSSRTRARSADYRLGHDFDHYYGKELRFGFGYLELNNGQPAQPNSADYFLDAHLLHYPWGDARWRPFASIGMGFANFRFRDAAGRKHDERLFHLPVGMGVKYYYRKWLVLRAELMDNLAFGGNGLDTMHNVSLTGGVEVRFGGWRRKYEGWGGGIHYW
tara:strand:+ start:167 stop:691 length:525 start_codon:yes stop_codon:yes gene_type:complete